MGGSISGDRSSARTGVELNKNSRLRLQFGRAGSNLIPLASLTWTLWNSRVAPGRWSTGNLDLSVSSNTDKLGRNGAARKPKLIAANTSEFDCRLLRSGRTPFRW